MNDSKHNAFLVDQPAPPERIYGWLDSQLSIARYYGGCTYQGVSYVIDMQHPDKPLVRQDVLTAELKDAMHMLGNAVVPLVARDVINAIKESA